MAATSSRSPRDGESAGRSRGRRKGEARAAAERADQEPLPSETHTLASAEDAETHAAAGSPAPARSSPRAPSVRALRELLERSPLVSADLRAHWLRVLPALDAAQRQELAALLRDDAAEPPRAP